MANNWQIKLFLDQFRQCWPPKYFVVPRQKNRDSLANLGLTPKQRRDIIFSLCVQDYVEGPVPDEDRPQDTVWVFRKKLDNAEIYIKLKIYEVDGKMCAKCLSFHKSDASSKFL